MAESLPLFVAVPMLAAGVLVGLHVRSGVRQSVLFAVLLVDLAAAGVLLGQVWSGRTIVHHVGLWDGGLSIAFAADVFAALMLVVTVLLTLLTAYFARQTKVADEPFFCPLVLLITCGVNGALLTADLFNLFVFVEIMLLPSYALVMLAHRGEGRRAQVSAARIYVIVNLFTSSLFLIALALIYSGTGTVSLGRLGGAAHDSRTALLGSVLLLCALGIKAAIFPAHGWLAQAYPAMPPAITALFSSLHTKVAVYALFRVGSVLFEGRGLGWIAMAIFVASMIIGVLGALGENDARSILSFHMVSQIGYVLVGLALFTPAGMAAGIFYLIHNILAKGGLFLTVGAVEHRYGREPIGAVRGLLWREPMAGMAFLATAVSLAGLPPFSGFVAKLLIITASFSAGQWVAGIAALVVSLFTVMSMLKIWGGTFLGSPKPALADHEGARIGVGLIAPALVLAVLTLGLGIGGQALLHPAEVAAHGLLNPQAYLEAVAGR